MAGTWESWLYASEILISTLIPILLVWLPGTRGSPVALGVAAFSASAGLALNRMDVGIFGYFRDAGVVYFPSLAEWAVSLGVVAAAALVFLYFAENMGVFADSRGGHGEDRPFGASFDSLSRVWHSALRSGLERATVIGVFVIPLAWALMYPPFHQPEAPYGDTRRRNGCGPGEPPDRWKSGRSAHRLSPRGTQRPSRRRGVLCELPPYLPTR